MSGANGMPLGDDFIQEAGEIELVEGEVIDDTLYGRLTRIEEKLDRILEFIDGLQGAMDAMESSPMFGMFKGMMGG